MFRHYLFSALILLPFTLFAEDDRYHLLDSMPSGEGIYIDKHSISRVENGIEALIREPMKSAERPSVAYLKLLFHVNCGNNDMTLLKFIMSGVNDEILGSEVINEHKKGEEVIPDSPADKLRLFLCTHSFP